MPMKHDIKIKVSTEQGANVEQIKRDIKIKVSTEQNINVDLSNRVTVKTIEADHSKLDNLDYKHSGHTGFAPASILSDISVDEENEALLIGYKEEA